MKTSTLAAIVLSSISFAQDTGKTLRFAHTSNDQNMQEIATVMRAITDMPGVSTDMAARTLSLTGSAVQIQAAEWVFQELDRPLTSAPPASPRVYRMEDAKGEGIVRVFHVANAETPQQLQELATCIRATTEVRRLFTYNAPRVIVVRGTEEQVAVTEWLLQRLDKPAVTAGSSIARERPMTDRNGEGHLRVFFLAHATSPQSHQELATCVRAITDTRRLFTNTKHVAIVTRGTAGQMQAVEWLIREMDRPPAKSPAAHAPSKEFLMQEDAKEGVVRVFYTHKTLSVDGMNSLATDVRKQTSVRRIFTYGGSRAIAVRGTASQIARAGEIISASNAAQP